MILWIGRCCSTAWNTLLGSLVHQHHNSSLTHFFLISKCSVFLLSLSILSLCILSIHAVYYSSVFSLSKHPLFILYVLLCLSNVSSVFTLSIHANVYRTRRGWLVIGDSGTAMTHECRLLTQSKQTFNQLLVCCLRSPIVSLEA